MHEKEITNGRNNRSYAPLHYFQLTPFIKLFRSKTPSFRAVIQNG